MLNGQTAAVHTLNACAAVRSEELSRQLLRAWDTPTGIPYNTVNLRTGVGKNPSWTMRGSTLSEYGTEQLEFVTLSSLTGNNSYGNASEHVIRYLRQHYPEKVAVICHFKQSTWHTATMPHSLKRLDHSLQMTAHGIHCLCRY